MGVWRVWCWVVLLLTACGWPAGAGAAPGARQHDPGRAKPRQVSVDPTGRWALVDDPRGGPLVLWDLWGHGRRRLPSKWQWFPWVKTPWVKNPSMRDGRYFFVVEASDRSDEFVVVDPKNLRKRRVRLGGWAIGASAVASPDNRWIAFGSSSASMSAPAVDTASLLEVEPLWHQVVPGYGPLQGLRVPFRHGVEEVAWVDRNALVVLTVGLDLPEAEASEYQRKQFYKEMGQIDRRMWRKGQDELYLVDTLTWRSRPLPSPSTGAVYDVAPYVDSGGGLVALVRESDAFAVWRLGLVPGTWKDTGWKDVGPLPLAHRWFIAWANPDRIYFWRYLGVGAGRNRLAVEVAVYRPSRNSLERVALPPDVSGPICTDRVGRIYWWDGTRVRSRPPVD